MFFERFFAPKPPKKKHTALKVVGIVSAVLLTPIAFTCDKKRKSWGFGSLLYSVTKAPSEKNEGKTEYTITLPGIGFVIKSWRDALCRLHHYLFLQPASKDDVRDCCCDHCFCDDSDDTDFADAFEHAAEPEVEDKE